MEKYSKKAEEQYVEISKKGVVTKNSVDQWTLVKMIMKHGYEKTGKIWWFAYEVLGHWNIQGQNYFLSYKGVTRLCELASFPAVVARGTEGRLSVYALAEVLDQSK